MSTPSAGPPPGSAPAVSRDFRRLRESGGVGGFSRWSGERICAARDDVARWLVSLGLTPNAITVCGFVVTCGAGYCLFRGAAQQVPYLPSGGAPTGWWPALAALLLFLAGAFDMLDGAVARVSDNKTRFGGLLDSTLDRFSDMAIFLGCALHFALIGNITYQVLGVLALCNSFLISYVKARAEEIIPDCSVGYWLRGERFAAVLIGCASGHVPAVLWQLSLLTFPTVLRRVDYARRVIASEAHGQPPPPAGPAPGWRGWLQLWRYPRGSPAYDVVTGLNILFIIVGPWLAPSLLAGSRLADPLGTWLRG